jgi:hypothetical protein
MPRAAERLAALEAEVAALRTPVAEVAVLRTQVQEVLTQNQRGGRGSPTRPPTATPAAHRPRAIRWDARARAVSGGAGASSPVGYWGTAARRGIWERSPTR